MASVPTEKLFRLLYRFILKWETDSEARSVEAREIALRTLANLALNPRHQSKFTDFGKFLTFKYHLMKLKLTQDSTKFYVKSHNQMIII